MNRVPAILLLALLGLTACGDDKEEIAALTKQLTSSAVDPKAGMPVAQVAAMRLGEMKALSAAPALVNVLRTNSDGQVRHAAAIGLCLMRSVDAIPVLIDAMLDSYGARLQLDQWMQEITDQDFGLPRTANRARIVEFQRHYRTWFTKHEDRLRELRGQPAPSKIPAPTTPPPHDRAATAGKVAGQYLGRRWDYDVLLLLRDDGYFELRAYNSKGDISWPRESGSWSVGEAGVQLVWERIRLDSRSKEMALRRDGTITTTAGWSADTLRVYPACRAPFDLALTRASGEDLSRLHSGLRFLRADHFVGRWTTRTRRPRVELTLAPDGTYTQVFNRGVRGAGTATGVWTFDDHRLEINLDGQKLLKANGTPSRHGAGQQTYRVDGDHLKGTRSYETEVLHRE